MRSDSATVPPNDAFEVDRKTLRLRLERFRTDHLNRLDALRKDLTADQRLILDVMPLLLHSKHAALPGYVDADTPRGIDNYRPNAVARRAARQIALSYTEPRFVENENHIQGLFLCGHHSLRAEDTAHNHAAPGNPRMRFRVFCGAARHPTLTEKTRRIQRWAEARDVLVEIELFDPDRWRDAETTNTPNLDLDAFYSNAIHLAGRFPLWWLVPLSQQANHSAYCKRLVRQRFIKSIDFFDLGEIAEIPSGEIFRGSLEELDTALENPWQSLPRLLLLEAYAAAPVADLLSQRYKAWVTRPQEAPSSRAAGTGSILSPSTPVDLPGLLLTQCLEAYLKPRHQLQRLTLCRFPSRVTITQRIELGSELTTELHQTFSQLLSLGSAVNSDGKKRTSATESELKKFAAFERKINQLDPARHAGLPVILPALRRIRPSGFLKLTKSADSWTLAGENGTVFHAPRLAAVAAWAVLQELGAERLTCTDVSTRSVLARMMEILTPFLDTIGVSPPPDRDRLLVFVNAEEEGLDELTEQGDALLSDRNDALDFSGFHHILVHSFDLLRQDPQGHVVPRSLVARELADDLLGQALTHLCDPELNDVQLHTIGNLKRHQIDVRLRQLILDLRTALEHASGTRFILALGPGYLCCSVNEASALDTHYLEGDAALFNLLDQKNSASSTFIDPNSPRLKPLARAMEVANPGEVTLLIQASGMEYTLYLVRENGALNRFLCPTKEFSLAGLIDELTQFLNSPNLQHHQKPRIVTQQEAGLIEYPMIQPLSNPSTQASEIQRQSHNQIPMGQLLAEHLAFSFSHIPALNQRSRS